MRIPNECRRETCDAIECLACEQVIELWMAFDGIHLVTHELQIRAVDDFSRLRLQLGWLDLFDIDIGVPCVELAFDKWKSALGRTDEEANLAQVRADLEADESIDTLEGVQSGDRRLDVKRTASARCIIRVRQRRADAEKSQIRRRCCYRKEESRIKNYESSIS